MLKEVNSYNIDCDKMNNKINLSIKKNEECQLCYFETSSNYLIYTFSVFNLSGETNSSTRKRICV